MTGYLDLNNRSIPFLKPFTFPITDPPVPPRTPFMPGKISGSISRRVDVGFGRYDLARCKDVRFFLFLVRWEKLLAEKGLQEES